MNSSQNQVSRQNVRKGAAALSAITLALGSLSILSNNGGIAPEATAASGFTGGIRGADGNGAVEKDAQKPSDLPAGSCAVASDGRNSGSQGGFTWYTLEPGQESQDKKQWGLSVAFDNSKGRTFADWAFSNSGNLGNVLKNDSVPSMDAGKTLLYDKDSVTAKADESIEITGPRNQKSLTLEAQLTADKVKQFAQAGADAPVRYAWQGTYTKDNNPDDHKATRGSSALFTALVNPWPSENDNCSPITV